MKVTLFAMFVALLMVGCGGDEKSGSDSSESKYLLPPQNQSSAETIDLDDNETRNRIIAEAIDYKKLQKRGKEGEELAYAPNQQTPYTGWTKNMYKNGQMSSLIQYKDGKEEGLATWWHENGQKAADWDYKDSKRDGLHTTWYESGLKASEGTFKDGKVVTIVGWKLNGEKCPVTNVVNGNGVWVKYMEDGRGVFRFTVKDGEW